MIAEPVPAVAHVSETHFSRSIRSVSGETPHRFLQRRRIERAMFLLRETDRTVTEVCFDVGFTSLGTFSRTSREIVGETPAGYRRGHGPNRVRDPFVPPVTRLPGEGPLSR